MTIDVEVNEFEPKAEALVDDLAQNGGEIRITRHGEAVAKMIRVDCVSDVPAADQPRADGRVLYNGRWMIPAAAERERSIEHLRGSGKILGDIVSPIYEGPMAGSVIDEGDIISPIDVEWEAAK
jgi:antitoxin (DNA-binding transcriptional repressor) of toxin-antitoxin stability system